MQIDKSNYEVWIVDWLDGKLNNFQVERIKLFLHENPDIRDEFYDIVNLNIKPPDDSFRNKGRLIKSATDIPVSQFEYLCVGYLENDLSEDQLSELTEIIENDLEKKKSFELILNTRLVPVTLSYKHKSTLLKRTVTQRAIRISVIGLSVAATLVLILMTYILIPRNSLDKTYNTAQNNLNNSNLVKPAQKIVSDNLATEKNIVQPKKQKEKLLTVIQKKVNEITAQDVNSPVGIDSVVRNTDNPEIQVARISSLKNIEIKEEIASNTLVSYKSTFSIPAYDDGRSKLGKFIAKTVRDKILKENSPKDGPLKGYEIAEAGVSGLNKLLGWEMALNEKNNENGELSSIYFSSKILKFNASVKKTESLP